MEDRHQASYQESVSADSPAASPPGEDASSPSAPLMTDQAMGNKGGFALRTRPGFTEGLRAWMPDAAEHRAVETANRDLTRLSDGT